MALPESHINIAGFEDPAQASASLDSRLTNFATQRAENSQQDQNHDTSGISRLSRVSSPPNDASEEDKWPFAWNPRSRPLLSCNPIIWPDDHPLLTSHNLKYDMSASTYEKVMRCVTSINNFHYSSDQRVQFSMPTLSVSNVFVGLFFEYFLPQMPVIHLPTVNVDKDLPPSLLAAMIVIGAIYSREKHTRRFAILLLDLTRRSLLSSIELNNSLIREPMIIYALCLICYTGLWCGNKRSFELAEAVRGFMVSFCRRKGFGNIFHGGPMGNPEPPDMETRWRKWASEESLKRLSWVVYTLDYQFPSLLNLPATISLGELSYQECPCDEEFWVAPNARHWKRLLGSASVPPSKWFSAALGPFIVPHVGNGSTTQSISGAEDPPVLNLNPWSRFLVLLAIHAQIYNFSQEMTLISRICGDENSGYSYGANYRIRATENESVAEEIRITLGGSADTSEWTVWHVLANTKHQLLSALTSWASAYGQIPQGHPQESATSVFFHSCSKPLHQLGLILLDAPLTQLQDAIGKGGPSHIPEAMRNLSLWANTSQQLRQSTVVSFETITSMAPVNNHVLSQQLSNMGPWSIIPCFISHVVLWAFAQVAGSMQRQQLIERIQHDERHLRGPFSAVLHRALNTAISAERGLPEVNLSQNGGQKVIFRSAADVLTRMGTWGCSLNLALLLYERSKL
ncbi:fungal-specific transcription factor domain-containing protein [Bisporella sp. PMI_857]|nr:fungal-specific transcription factor domain-containing protein [Bisporella sp. PMI_857]